MFTGHVFTSKVVQEVVETHSTIAYCG